MNENYLQAVIIQRCQTGCLLDPHFESFAVAGPFYPEKMWEVSDRCEIISQLNPEVIKFFVILEEVFF